MQESVAGPLEDKVPRKLVLCLNQVLILAPPDSSDTYEPPSEDIAKWEVKSNHRIQTIANIQFQEDEPQRITLAYSISFKLLYKTYDLQSMLYVKV